MNAPIPKTSRPAEGDLPSSRWKVAAVAIVGGVLGWRFLPEFGQASDPSPVARRGARARFSPLRVVDALWDGTEFNQSKVKTAAAGSCHGSAVNPYLKGGIDEVLTIEQISERGELRYAELKKKLEAEHHHRCVCINVTTGEYVLGDTFREVHTKFEDRFGDVPSWDTRIGCPTHVAFGAGVL